MAQRSFDRSSVRDDGFESIYRRYFGALVGYCTRRVGDPGIAEDLAQETFLRAYRYLGGLDPQRSPWPWLKAIARNVICDQAARLTREPPVDAATQADRSGVEDVEGAMVLGAAMSSLSERDRAAIALRYVGGYDSSSAAARLGLSIAAYEQRLSRARTRLRIQLAKLEAFPAAVLVPVGWIRARMRQAALRLGGGRRADSPFSRLATEGLVQLAIGIAAMVVVSGGLPDAPAAAEPSPRIGSVQTAPRAEREPVERKQAALAALAGNGLDGASPDTAGHPAGADGSAILPLPDLPVPHGAPGSPNGKTAGKVYVGGGSQVVGEVVGIVVDCPPAECLIPDLPGPVDDLLPP